MYIRSARVRAEKAWSTTFVEDNHTIAGKFVHAYVQRVQDVSLYSKYITVFEGGQVLHAFIVSDGLMLGLKSLLGTASSRCSTVLIRWCSCG